MVVVVATAVVVVERGSLRNVSKENKKEERRGMGGQASGRMRNRGVRQEPGEAEERVYCNKGTVGVGAGDGTEK